MDLSARHQRRPTRRRIAALSLSVALPLALVAAFEHRGEHMARSLLVPGAGLFDVHPWAGAAFAAAAVLATISWLRWGADALLALVVIAAVATSGLVDPGGHHDASTELTSRWAAHEFPLVVLVVGALTWVAGVVRGLPGARSLVHRRAARRAGIDDVEQLSPIDRCRTAAVAVLAGADPAVMRRVVEHPDIVRRVRRVDAVARGRRASFPPVADHAAVRAAAVLTGGATADALAADAATRPLGVPSSEPTWVRLLDATLAAVTIDVGHDGDGAGHRWQRALAEEFALRRGHRPAWYWTPLGVAATSAPAWEHAAATALARWRGWVDDADWSALRQRCLGAAARGTSDPHDERLIAAARVWLVFVEDDEARRIVARPTVSNDPLACALDALATRLTAPG